MLSLIPGPLDRPLRVLCLGAHSDDIEIGCGGTLLRLIAERPVECDWVLFTANDRREAECRRSAELFLEGATRSSLRVHRFRDGYLPFQGTEVKDSFEELKALPTPDIVFTHYRTDRHQDHRLISDLTWNTFRNHLVLEYEIPKFDGDLGQPNVFVSLDRPTCQKKIDRLLEVFASQRDKAWFQDETFWGLMRIRGMEAGAGVPYAEAFYSRKIVL